jgi:hypothetical protein
MFSASTVSSFVAIVCLGFGSTTLAGQKNHPPTHAPKAEPATHTTSPSAHPAHFITQIEQNPRLMSRLQPLLPSGTTLESAAQGFRNEGQFIAALHVSQNLKIPFTDLKAEMTGKDRDSLGQAIHELRPNGDAKAAAKTAEQEAETDIKATKPAKTGNDNDKDNR